MSKTKVIIRNGISFNTLLFIVFFVLKLTGVIGWSWLWIFSPLWIPVISPFVFVILLLPIIIIVLIIIYILDNL